MNDGDSMLTAVAVSTSEQEAAALRWLRSPKLPRVCLTKMQISCSPYIAEAHTN